MSCNVVRYKKAGDIKWAVVKAGQLWEIPGNYSTTAEFLAQGAAQAKQIAQQQQAAGLTIKDVEVLSPITTPCRVLCQGANYRQHMIDSGMDPDQKSYNMFFTKSSASVAKPNTDIRRPKHVKLLDYEVELGLVIGRTVTASSYITDQDLPDYIAALVIGDDVSARDVQLPQTQFFKGKSYRTFCPVGPYLCLLDTADFAYLNNLDLTLTVNGEIRQKDNTRNLVYKPAETLSEFSEITDLAPGDLILTGTPSGCALKAPAALIVKLFNLLPEKRRWEIFVKVQSKRPQYLKPGDRVKASIKSPDGKIDLGMQENLVVQG